MKVIFALVLLSVHAVAVEKAEVTPVQKVVQLMQGMLAKGQKEKHAEQVECGVKLKATPLWESDALVIPRLCSICCF